MRCPLNECPACNPGPLKNDTSSACVESCRMTSHDETRERIIVFPFLPPFAVAPNRIQRAKGGSTARFPTLPATFECHATPVGMLRSVTQSVSQSVSQGFICEMTCCLGKGPMRAIRPSRSGPQGLQ